MSWRPPKKKTAYFGFQIPNNNSNQYTGNSGTYQLQGVIPNLTNSSVNTAFSIHMQIPIPIDFHKLDFLGLKIIPLAQGKPFTITTEVRQVLPVNHPSAALASASDAFAPNYTALAAIGNQFLHLCPNALTSINSQAITISQNGGIIAVRINYPGSAGGAINTKHLYMIMNYE